jgi:ketosteroid isomerase-like protein
MKTKVGSFVTLVVLLSLLVPALAGVALAQETTPEAVVQQYYTTLGQVAGTGDTAPLLDLFADDATIDIPGLSPQPVQGKEAMQSTFAGMFALLQGLTVTVGDVTVEGDQVTVSYTMAVSGMEGTIPATDTFVVQDGLIQSLTIQLAAEALSGMGLGAAAPAALPQTGGAGVNLFPGLLLLGGAALVAVSRRLPA